MLQYFGIIKSLFVSVYYGALRGHGFDRGVIFGYRPHVRGPAWIISHQNMIFVKKKNM